MGVKTLYRLLLQPRGATLSPWQADTLFGHLCWQVYFERGKTGLADFLAPFRAGTPPFVLSDGFPGDWLPRPILPAPSSMPGSETKKIKKATWLTPDEFRAILRGEYPAVSDAESPVREPQVVLKNQINRLTGTTAGDDDDAGNLYALDEIAFYRGKEKREGVPVSVYFWAQDSAQAAEVTDLVGSLARGGYGKKKSVGYGQFTVGDCETIEFAYPDDADAIVALASFVPRQTDPTKGYYRTRVKYGKLGEGGIVDGKAYSPFKFPLVMLTAGSTFCSNVARDFVGRIVTGIHPQDLTGDEFVQYAFAPVVPIKMPTWVVECSHPS
jgi:CRISPR-associated protein Csm4